MGVPEQLRRLDEDLATGRVDAESYRRRRDELLAARLPAPPPPAPADDLDDSELDAADRELGLEDDAAAARTRAATTTPDARHGVRGAPPPPARPNGVRPPMGPGAAPAPTSPTPPPHRPPHRTPPPGTPPFSRRPPISGPAHPGGPRDRLPGDPAASSGPARGRAGGP